MKRALRVIAILAVVVAIGLGGYIALAQARAPKDPDYQVVPVTRATVLDKVSATGSIEPRVSVNLSFRGTGPVAEVAVRSGQSVEEGQLLARLDSRELELALERAQVTLQISETQLAQLEAGPTAGELAAAEAAVASARAAYDKVVAGPSAEDIASAQGTLDSARASLAKLLQGPDENEITVAKANLEQARIALEQAQAEYDKVSWVGAVGSLPQSLQLQQATISYEAAQANYELATQGPAESQIKAAQSQVAQAQGALDRLLDSPTESDLAAAEAQVVQAQANLDKLRNTPTQEQLVIAQQQVVQSQIAVEQAQLALDGARLTAPFAGVVTAVNITPDENAPVGQPAIALMDLTSFYVDVSVDEIDVPRVAVGQDANLILDALEETTIPGRVESVATASSLNGGAVGYTVRISIDQPDPRLKPGMTATVEIVTEKHVDVLTVPGRAIQVDRETGQAYVEKLVNGQPVETPIEVGLRGDQVSEVVSGLSDGDQVIIRSVSSLQRLQQAIGE